MRAVRLEVLKGNPRSGFTRVEMAVLLSIGCILVALAVPALLQWRESARRTECANHLRQIGIALQNRSSVAPRFAGYGAYLRLLDEHGEGTEVIPAYSWVVDLIFYIGKTDAADSWDRTRAFYDPHDPANPNTALSQLRLKVFTCPADPAASGVDGGLSYVVNAGYSDLKNSQRHDEESINWNDDAVTNGPLAQLGIDPEDAETTRDSGVFWLAILTVIKGNVATRSNGSQTFKSIVDGLSQTILVTENTNAGVGTIEGSVVRSFANPDYRASSFVFPVRTGENDDADFGHPELAAEFKSTGRINGQIRGAAGNYPFPSSYHRAGVNGLFADGSVKFLSVLIEDAVYAEIVSPAGSRRRFGVRGKIGVQGRFDIDGN